MIRFLKWFLCGGGPKWLPSATYVNRFEQGCTFTGTTLPHGDWWWICVSVEPSGTKGQVEVRRAPLSDKDKAVTRAIGLPLDEISRMSDLIQRAAARKGRVTRVRDSVRDGFPADVRISLAGKITRFRYNLLEEPSEPDARADLAKAMFALGKMLIDGPSFYGACTADGQIIIGEA